ncbi:TPA: hypothetical protein R4Y39_000470 [Raoultella planticola]|nr:hypothetical protein [Raoultella planticola]
MSKWNIAAKSPEEQDKVNVDLAASCVAYKERLNMPFFAQKHNNWYRRRKIYYFWFVQCLYQTWHLLLKIRKKQYLYE